MFFTFPENVRWDPERQAVEFGVEIGEYQGVVRVARHVFQRLLPESATPERCVEAYYLQRTRFESIAERKLRLRQLTEDGNVEITGRDLRGDLQRCPEVRDLDDVGAPGTGSRGRGTLEVCRDEQARGLGGAAWDSWSRVRPSR
jgi:hypothetical protein